eukprot:IDg10361t1
MNDAADIVDSPREKRGKQASSEQETVAMLCFSACTSGKFLGDDDSRSKQLDYFQSQASSISIVDQQEISAVRCQELNKRNKHACRVEQDQRIDSTAFFATRLNSDARKVFCKPGELLVSSMFLILDDSKLRPSRKLDRFAKCLIRPSVHAAEKLFPSCLTGFTKRGVEGQACKAVRGIENVLAASLIGILFSTAEKDRSSRSRCLQDIFSGLMTQILDLCPVECSKGKTDNNENTQPEKTGEGRVAQ